MAHSKIEDPYECQNHNLLASIIFVSPHGMFPVGLNMMGFNYYFYKIKLFMLFLHISIEKYTQIIQNQ
jgi:hypothetical protein